MMRVGQPTLVASSRADSTRSSSSKVSRKKEKRVMRVNQPSSRRHGRIPSRRRHSTSPGGHRSSWGLFAAATFVFAGVQSPQLSRHEPPNPTM